jgi:TPR repeat protein
MEIRMSLMLAALASLLQPTTAPTAAGLCDVLERKQDRTPIELHELATCLFRGEGRPRDLARARALYREAADRGFARAQCALGNMMIQGEGGPTDVAGGLALCRRAAEAGEPHAQTDFGNYLLMGQVMPKDAVEARRWYTLAARQGQANAAFVLGQIYWNGDGVAQDRGEAARWWRVAHEGGRPEAIYLLAREAMMRFAAGGRDNVDPAAAEEALGWFTLAAERDPSPANRQDAVEKSVMLRQYLGAVRQREGR